MKNQSAAKAKASMTKRTKKASAPSTADTFRAPADEAGAKKVAPVMVYLSGLNASYGAWCFLT